MKLRNPLIAFGILVALSAYVYIVEIKGGEKRQKEKEAKERVYSLQAGDVTGLQIIRPAEKVQLVKTGKEWRISEPLSAAADSDAVDRTVRSLEDLKISRDLGEQAELASFHLEDPAFRLEVQAIAKKAPPTLSLGDEAPTGGGTYARLGDSKKVLVITGASSLQGTTFFSLRDKTLLEFDPSRLGAFRLLRGKDEIALSRAGGKWSFAHPVKAPAEDSSVSDLLFALQRLAVSEFVEESPAAGSLAGRGLKPPQIRVALAGEQWQGEKELCFGNQEGGSLYALHPATGALVRIPDSIQAKLKSTVADLRKKGILPFPSFEITRLKMIGIAPEPLELERTEDHTWKRLSPSPGTPGTDLVDQLLRALDDLKAEAFEDNPQESLARHGLSRPAIRLEFWKRDQEEAQPAVVEIGAKDAKENLPMRDPSWPSVLMVPASAWEEATRQAARIAQEEAPAETEAPPASPAKEPQPPGGGS